ncbi:MAG: AAA family ATPase [Chloroflexi bacterium]|nr:AAA family ATPase [Chloroflexota bacterium]
MEIHKPPLKAAPRPPKTLLDWMDNREIDNSSLDMPPLRERIPAGAPPSGEEVTGSGQFRELKDCPEVKMLWEKYVEQEWWPWAEKDRELQKIQKVYTDLFSIYQKQQRLGEQYEVVLGLGCLAWRTPEGQEIKRHLITAQTALTFDSVRGIITVGPAGEGAKLALEQDMVEPSQRPSATEQQTIETTITEIGDEIWDGTLVNDVLKSWVHAVSERGQFDDTLEPPSRTDVNPIVHLAPAIILRKRTERNLLRVLQKIIDQLSNEESQIPVGIKRLTMIMDDTTHVAREDEDFDAESAVAQDIYFPLPANEQQIDIATKLSARQGVLVEGPPGTGKSHTIANLVCHLLATGKRVLVTSHTSRALRVLRDKFPKDVAQLCIVLLGDDINAIQALEYSVQGITDRNNRWNPQANRTLEANLEKELDEARRHEAQTLSKLRAVREAETYRHMPLFGSYKGTGAAIASQLREEEARHSWLSVEPEAEHEPPVSDEEAVELLQLLRLISTRGTEELALVSLKPEVLVAPDKFAAMVSAEKNAYSRLAEAERERSHSAYPLLAKARPEQLGDLSNGLADFVRTCEAVSNHIQPWVARAAKEITAGLDGRWRELFNMTMSHLAFVEDRCRQASELQILGLGNRDRSIVRAHASELLHHLETGGKLGFWPFVPKVVKEGKYLIKEVYVDGRLCDSPQSLKKLIEWLEIADHLEVIKGNWCEVTEPPSGTFATQVSGYLDLCKALESSLGLRDKVLALKELIGGIPGLPEPTWHTVQDLKSLQRATKAAMLEKELERARKPFEDLENIVRPVALSPQAHPANREVLESVAQRDVDRYQEAYSKQCNLKESKEQVRRRNFLRERLEACATELVKELGSSFQDENWDNRMAQFTAAWSWRRADRWLRELRDSNAHRQLVLELDAHRRRVLELTSQLAAEKAWGHVFHRLDEEQRQHLVAWTMAIKRIGKDKGKYASMHRRAARDHMEKCRSAIPAWIMPIYRVAESINPVTDAFDVVIIDEASQSGPEALFLQYLAKKIIVVGDDKQISPDNIGIVRENVELLRQKYIPDLPHSDALGSDNSFFDQAKIRYGGRVRLREHFRCMPEIIQFSNNLCYGTEPLEPLRQYGADRLEPVIVRPIIDGYQRGSSGRIENPPEAEAVADEIKRCCQDPAYNGKSMGVISLLGEAQANLIHKLLLERIGPQEVEKRSLVCGDSYAFQGDERDVMFLSLVSAPGEGHRIGTLTSDRDKRRFNVAVSRARDQLWLFHTATLNDLSHDCLRYQLLDYCLNPKVEPRVLEGIDTDALRNAANNSSRRQDAQSRPFESWFEVDVFLKILERGYRVIPQFEVAGRRIDLVVVGMQGRLAVECDGDEWHGAEKYDEDMARQRILERCGWTFWRVLGSEFYRNQDQALESLWETLDKHEIYPHGRTRRAHSGSVPTEIIQTYVISPDGGEDALTSAPGETEANEEHQLGFEGIEANSSVGSGEVAMPARQVLKLQRGAETRRENGVGKGSANFFLAPYRGWIAKPLPDPRTASTNEVELALVEIIDAEGPMPCHRAYHIYAKAAGIHKVGRQIRDLFNRAISQAVGYKLLEEAHEYGTNDQMNKVVRKYGTSPVVPRLRSDRQLDEIPPSELAAVMNWLLQQKPGFDDEELLRRILDIYEVERLTSGIRERLLQVKRRLSI